MKYPHPTGVADALPVLDIHCPDHVARLGEAYSRERLDVLDAISKLASMGFSDSRRRENTCLATMEPMPGHELMSRGPREVLGLRVALFLVSCHEHRRN